MMTTTTTTTTTLAIATNPICLEDLDSFVEMKKNSREKYEAFVSAEAIKVEQERVRAVSAHGSLLVEGWKRQLTRERVLAKLSEAKFSGATTIDILVCHRDCSYTRDDYITMFDEHMRPVVEEIIDTRWIGINAFVPALGRNQPFVVQLFFRSVIMPDLWVYNPQLFCYSVVAGTVTVIVSMSVLAGGIDIFSKITNKLVS